MLYGGNGEAVDVADGAVEHMQAGEDAQLDIPITHFGIVLAQALETVIVDSVQRLFHFPPVASADADMLIFVRIQFLGDFRTLDDEVFQEGDGCFALLQQFTLGFQLSTLERLLPQALVHFMFSSPSIGQASLPYHLQT